MPNIVKRLLSALFLVPVVVFIYWLDHPYWEAFLALVAGLIAFEWFKLIGNAHAKMHGALLGLFFLLFTVLPAVDLWAVVVLGIPAGLIGQKQHKHLGFLAGPYIALPVASVLAVGEVSTMVLLWLALVVWTTDSFALLFGKTIGGAKLAPTLSPNKTWAGLLGGVLGALLITGLFMISPPLPSPSLYFWAIVVSLSGQLGDLFESKYKRQFNVKDSGGLIPGHGGILDRMDSFLFAAPVVWVLVNLELIKF